MRALPRGIHAGTSRLDVEFDQSAGRVRLVRFAPPSDRTGGAPGRPAIEVITMDAGRAPSTGRLVGGVASGDLSYVAHRRDHRAGWTITEIDLSDAAGLSATLRIEIPDDVAGVRCTTTISNTGTHARLLRSVTSLALQVDLGGMTDPGGLDLWAAASDWVGEARWSRTPLRDLLPDLHSASHGRHGFRACHAVTSSGTWSTGRALPTGVLTARVGAAPGLAWTIEHNGAWRWEVGEEVDGAYLALSGPTDADHGWTETLEPGRSFTTVPVLLATGDGLDGTVAELTRLRRALRRREHPPSSAVVVYNDYMNTLMGDPTADRLLPLIDRAADAGAEVFCIDAGWYDDSGDWWPTVGEWIPSTRRFPEGLAAITRRIRDRDMIPGLWLEPEVIGVASPVAERLPDSAFLTRGGQRVVEHGRYHLDLSDPAARARLDEVVDRLVADYDIGYLKLDYNIDPGAGSDRGGVSPGAGLLRHNRAHLDWLDGLRRRHPHVILENCASGAMRMDAAMLSRVHLQSTSDQQDPLAYPPIAASAPLSMAPEQAGNWAYPQPEMTDEQIAFTLCTGILGTMYLSGHLDTMSDSQRILVAEGVAVHRRLRDRISASTPRWPLGPPGWTDDWVALGLATGDELLLTVWRRGASPTVRIPLPEFRTAPPMVETLFPQRLTPWRTDWDEKDAVLTVTIDDGSQPSARTFRIGSGPDRQRVDLDLAATDGNVTGRAGGMLYGVAAPDVPSAAVVAGARPASLAQKPPGGLQHPDGDAAVVAESSFAAGVSDVLVYLQDCLADWPYEPVGIDRYLDLIRPLIAEIAARADSRGFIYVPFNEGDWIWYEDWDETGRTRFLDDWERTVRLIRSIHPGARIAGPNEARFLPERLEPFLVGARARGVLPDLVSWHELHPSSLERLPAHVQRYRAMEHDLGIGPLPITIDEYANRQDTSVPGRMLRWIATLERLGVEGDIAFWTMAGNLDDHAVGHRRVNGGWWLLHWYAGLRGARLAVPPLTTRDSLAVVGAVDGPMATILVGGAQGEIELRVGGVANGPRRIRIERARWTGYQGAIECADLVSDRTQVVRGGRIDIAIPDADPSSAYRVAILPAVPEELRDAPDRVIVVPAADARGSRVVWLRSGDDIQQYAASARRAVERMPSGSSLEVTVPIPESGTWEVAIGYGTDGAPAATTATLDGDLRVDVALPATLSRGYSGRAAFSAELDAGDHLVRIAPPADRPERGDIAVDRVELSRRFPVRSYLAALGRRTGGSIDRSGAVKVVKDDAVRFFVAVAERARYRLALESTGAFSASLADAVVDVARPMLLPAGVSIVDVTATGPGDVTALRVERVGAAVAVAPIDPVVGREFAAHGAGPHLLTLHYSHAERREGHLYNVDAVVGEVLITVAGGPPLVVHLPPTPHPDDDAEVSFPLDLSGADAVHVAPGRRTGLRLRSAVLERVQDGDTA